MSELIIPGYYVRGNEYKGLNPSIATALSTIMEVMVPNGDVTEVCRWINGELVKLGVMDTTDNRIRIRFRPDEELVGGELDFGKIERFG